MSLHCGRFVASALRAEPLSLGLVGQLDAGEVEPLDGAQVVVAADHLAVGDLEKEASLKTSGTSHFVFPRS